MAAQFLDLALRLKRPGRALKYDKPLYLIDSSVISLNPSQYLWATFRKTKGGVKLHLRLVFLDNLHQFPEGAVITPAKEHYRHHEVLVKEKVAMYIFDRGYLDFQKFDDLWEQRYTFLTLLKKNTFSRQTAYLMRVIEVEDT